MNYWVSYGMSCNIGKRRRNNQDNFWCNGTFLNELNQGLSEVRCGIQAMNERPVFAVFDGMGGEQRGESAAFIAADGLDRYLKENSGSLDEENLKTLFRRLNNDICSFGEENEIGILGSTGALLAFGKKYITLCNIGDSPVFRLNEGFLTKESIDHSLDVGRKKAPLTQFLGVPVKEFIIEPYTSKLPLINGDRYLICSDGITDMIETREIAEIMNEEASVGECAKQLLCTALERGGLDNITLIVIEIHKVTPFRKNYVE